MAEYEKLIAISDLFKISLDELVMDKVPTQIEETTSKLEITSKQKEKVLKVLKIAAIIFGGMLVIDVISMIAYVSLYSFPQ